MISVNENQGFRMTFRNGWTVSVQFGPGNYCDNKDRLVVQGWRPGEKRTEGLECANAEIAAFNDGGEVWHKFEHDTVSGYCQPNEIADFIALVAAKPEEG